MAVPIKRLSREFYPVRVVHGLGQPTGWVGLGWSFGGLGWVEQIGPTVNSVSGTGYRYLIE